MSVARLLWLCRGPGLCAETSWRWRAPVRRFGVATALVVSMGNDLYGGGEATAIAGGLKDVLEVLPGGHVVYGGSASVWGYADDTYDKGVKEVCTSLVCPDGSVQLASVRTVDAIGHLHVESVPQLCSAVVQWCVAIRRSWTPMARL